MAALNFNVEKGLVERDNPDNLPAHHNLYHENKTKDPRKKVIEISSRIIELLHETAFDSLRPMTESQVTAVQLLMPMITDVVKDSKKISKTLNVRGKGIGEQIDDILNGLSQGELSFTEAKDYLSMISQGYELTELPELMKKLEAIENANS